MPFKNGNWDNTVLKCKESYTVTYKKINEKEEKEETVTEVLIYSGKSTLSTTVEGVDYTTITTKWNNDTKRISGTDIVNITQIIKGGRRNRRTRRHRTKRSHTRK